MITRDQIIDILSTDTYIDSLDSRYDGRGLTIVDRLTVVRVDRLMDLLRGQDERIATLEGALTETLRDLEELQDSEGYRYDHSAIYALLKGTTDEHE